MKIKVPTLETERLILRMWKKKDAPELYEYAKNPNVGPHAGWTPHGTIYESKMIITKLFLTSMCWAIVDKETGKVIGNIGLEEDKYRPGIKSKELGYSLSEDHWKKGIMTEAAKRVIKYAFDDLKLDVLMIKANDTNHRSHRVIEKCGFTYEGMLRRAYLMVDGSIREVKCYSMLKEEYKTLLAENKL